MYQDLIRNELNEAAETLANFLKDDANIHAIQRAAVPVSYTHLRKLDFL